MIQLITYSDAEGGRLVQEKNFRDETPLVLDDKNKFDYLFHHIWEHASISSSSSVERMEWLIKNKKQSANQKTLVGQNTPLHFAVINENLKAIEFLCK